MMVITHVKLWLAALCLLFSAPALSEAVPLPVGNNHLQPFEATQYFIDEEAKLSAGDVLERRGNFRPVGTRWIDFGEQKGRIWLIVRATNGTGQDGEWMLDIQRQWVDDLVVLKISADGTRQTLLRSDNTTPFAKRPVASPYLVAPLPMQAGETSDILIGMKSATGSWMPVTFATAERMRTAHMHEAQINWLLMGAIMALVLVALALGQLVGWRLSLSFAAYAVSGSLLVANNEGYLFQYWWPNSPALYDPLNLALLLTMVATGLQFARTFVGLDEHHPRANGWLRSALIGTVLMIPVTLVLPQVTVVRWAVYAVVPLAAAAYLAIAWTAHRNNVLGGIPFMLGALAVAATLSFTAAVFAFPGTMPLTVALDYAHFTLLIEALAFLIAILMRMLQMQRALNVSLREKYALASALNESNAKFDTARRKAEGYRSALASTSHDLQQPLMSLRRGVKQLAVSDPVQGDRFNTALEYLEELTSTGLENTASDNPLAGEKPDEGVESFPISIIAENCRTMFTAAASAKGIELRLHSSEANVLADPVALMRAVCNLVSNAINHSGGSKVLLALRPRSDHVLLQVFDDGSGMTPDQITELGAAYAKGADSEGTGLGLALVHGFARTTGHSLQVSSVPGQGTTFTLKLAKP
ncbi:sensor histidine kinase [Altererythrobacter sp. ZODW24]|uniref:sensor histidine kinase n=1 Tax=Altererythrobacter sp. ZODW24 TaxID=2185142 RepID=UPI000DF84897|nr:sensor histidine kinase [Altererythrobacter sp. ZODW24]